MSDTAVDKDQHTTTSRVQCYNDFLPSPTDLGVGTGNTIAKPWPAESHNINCTKTNSNTRIDAGNFMIFSSSLHRY